MSNKTPIRKLNRGTGMFQRPKDEWTGKKRRTKEDPNLAEYQLGQLKDLLSFLETRT